MCTLFPQELKAGQGQFRESMASGTIIFSHGWAVRRNYKNNENGFYMMKNIDNISNKIIQIYKNHKNELKIIQKPDKHR